MDELQKQLFLFFFWVFRLKCLSLYWLSRKMNTTHSFKLWAPEWFKDIFGVFVKPAHFSLNGYQLEIDVSIKSQGFLPHLDRRLNYQRHSLNLCRICQDFTAGLVLGDTVLSIQGGGTACFSLIVFHRFSFCLFIDFLLSANIHMTGI